MSGGHTLGTASTIVALTLAILLGVMLAPSGADTSNALPIDPITRAIAEAILRVVVGWFKGDGLWV